MVRHMKIFITIICLLILSSCSLPDGPFETYYENGQLDERGNYKDGKEDGVWEKYYENGELEERDNWKDGELID